MTGGVRREERRLRRVFMRAVWIAVATPIAIPIACGNGGTSRSGGAGGGASSLAATGASSSSETGASSSSGSGGGDAGTDGANPVDAGHEASPCDPVMFAPDPPDKCGNYVRLPCGLPPGVTPVADCYLLLNDCSAVCDGLHFDCHAVNDSCVDGGVVPNDAGAVEIDCSICAGGIGRVPAGLAPARFLRTSEVLGAYFARAAHLEAASVHAFRRLHGELAVHRAPARLLRATRRAQRDEVRHAQRTGRLARRFGGAPVRASVAPLAPRALSVVAIENAVEGCIRETFGALVASFQAANARDPEIARLMVGIARDETRHAALSWTIYRWAWRGLDAEARGRLVAECREAISSLRRDAEAEVGVELLARAGLPNAVQRQELIRTLEERLWKI